MSREDTIDALGMYLGEITRVSELTRVSDAWYTWEKKSLQRQSFIAAIHRFFSKIGPLTYVQPEEDVLKTLRSSSNCIVVTDTMVFTARVLQNTLLQNAHPKMQDYFSDYSRAHPPTALLQISDFFFKMTNNKWENPTRKVDPNRYELTDYVISDGSKLSFLQEDIDSGNCIQKGEWTTQAEVPVNIRYVFQMSS